MKKKIAAQSISIDIPIERLEYWKGNLKPLPANQTFKLIIDYPISEPTVFIIKTGKKEMGLGGLLTKIDKAYQLIYDQPEKYGVWGHGISDLQLVGIKVNYKTKTIRLDVGS